MIRSTSFRVTPDSILEDVIPKVTATGLCQRRIAAYTIWFGGARGYLLFGISAPNVKVTGALLQRVRVDRPVMSHAPG
jgi:hypothetical protein